MAKKQKSFADKAAGSSDKDSVYIKYVNSVKSDKTGHWRFNEQMIKTKKGESLDVALKRLDEAANLSDIDLSEFVNLKSETLEQDVTQKESEGSDVKEAEELATEKDVTQKKSEGTDTKETEEKKV